MLSFSIRFSFDFFQATDAPILKHVVRVSNHIKTKHRYKMCPQGQIIRHQCVSPRDPKTKGQGHPKCCRVDAPLKSCDCISLRGKKERTPCHTRKGAGEVQVWSFRRFGTDLRRVFALRLMLEDRRENIDFTRQVLSRGGVLHR